MRSMAPKARMATYKLDELKERLNADIIAGSRKTTKDIEATLKALVLLSPLTTILSTVPHLAAVSRSLCAAP